MHTLDLANLDANNPYNPLVGYTYASPKYTHQENKLFYTWHGLRLWYITGRKYDGYLTAQTMTEVKSVKGGEWLYMSDLETWLMADLTYNVTMHPFVLSMFQHFPVEVRWSTGKVYGHWLELVTAFAATQYKG